MIDDTVVNTFRKRYEKEVFKYIYKKLGSRRDAKVLTQETFSKIAEIIQPILKHEEDPLAFLLMFAQGEIDDFLRHAPHASKLLEKYSSDKEVSKMIRAIRNKKIDARRWIDIKTLIYGRVVTNKLTPRYKAIFLLRKLKGYSYEEIARKLKIPISVIEVEIMRGLRATREAFTP